MQVAARLTRHWHSCRATLLPRCRQSGRVCPAQDRQRGAGAKPPAELQALERHAGCLLLLHCNDSPENKVMRPAKPFLKVLAQASGVFWLRCPDHAHHIPHLVRWIDAWQLAEGVCAVISHQTLHARLAIALERQRDTPAEMDCNAEQLQGGGCAGRQGPACHCIAANSMN